MAKQTAKQQIDQILSRSRPRSDLRAMLAVTDGEDVDPILIAIDLLDDNPYQPRKVMDNGELEALASVIREQGFQGVLVARPHPERPGRYQLAFGHRRRDASRRAGLVSLPLIVRDFSDTQMIVLAVTENVQRADLSPLEEGDIFLLMIDKLGYTQEQIAGEIGKNRGYIVNRLRVARAPQDVRLLVEDKPDSLRAVTELLKIGDDKLRAQAIADLRSGRITSDDLVKAVSGARMAPSGLLELAELEPSYEAHDEANGIDFAGSILPGSRRKSNAGRDELLADNADDNMSATPALTDKGSTVRRNGADLGSTRLSREQIRSRRGKAQLGRAIRVVQEFLDESQDRADISVSEITGLHDLEKLVQQAATRWRPGAEDVS